MDSRNKQKVLALMESIRQVGLVSEGLKEEFEIVEKGLEGLEIEEKKESEESKNRKEEEEQEKEKWEVKDEEFRNRKRKERRNYKVGEESMIVERRN